MILTELPDLPPRPETPANAAFRRDYVARWGKENTVLCGRSRLAEYPRVNHPLSIKMAWAGAKSIDCTGVKSMFRRAAIWCSTTAKSTAAP
jgi:hypothetical protein